MFLAVFLAISLPGGVILFMKKLDPKAPSMYMPDTVRRSLPYNAPEDATDLKRYVPEQTGKWVEGVAKEHGYPSVLSRGGLPVMSERRRWQVVGVRRAGNATEVGLLSWEEAGQAGGPLNVRVGRGGDAIEGQVRGQQVIAIPEVVRKELVYGGYPKPPKEVTWVPVVLPGSGDSPAVVRLERAGSAEGDSVTLFTE